jgi:hypothetical protein
MFVRVSINFPMMRRWKTSSILIRSSKDPNGMDSAMAYLLNIVYLIVLIAASPWLLWSAIRKGKYREGFAAKFLGSGPALANTRGPRLGFMR